MTTETIRATVQRIRFLDWKFDVVSYPEESRPLEIIISMKVPDSEQRGDVTPFVQAFRRISIIDVADAAVIIQAVRRAIHMQLCHEADELFEVDAGRPFHPHRYPSEETQQAMLRSILWPGMNVVYESGR